MYSVWGGLQPIPPGSLAMEYTEVHAWALFQTRSKLVGEGVCCLVAGAFFSIVFPLLRKAIRVRINHPPGKEQKCADEFIHSWLTKVSLLCCRLFGAVLWLALSS